MANRITYFDNLRGLAIIGVIAIHASDTGLAFEPINPNYYFVVAWRQLLNFSVPLFLAISGYFLVLKPVNNISEYLYFVRVQILRVYIPLLFWSFIWLIVATQVYSRSFQAEMLKIIAFQSSGSYYFIALIIQFYLLLPVLKRLANPTGLCISLAISIAAVLGIFYIWYFTNIHLPLIVYAGNFVTWLVFFVLGLYIGKGKTVILTNRLLILLIFAFYSLSCLEAFTVNSIFQESTNSNGAIKVSSFLYSFFLIVLFFKNINLIKNNFLKVLGDASFGIFLIHMFVLLMVSIGIEMTMPQLKNMQPVLQLLQVSAVSLICFFIVKGINQVAPTTLRAAIGFK